MTTPITREIKIELPTKVAAFYSWLGGYYGLTLEQELQDEALRLLPASLDTVIEDRDIFTFLQADLSKMVDGKVPASKALERFLKLRFGTTEKELRELGGTKA